MKSWTDYGVTSRELARLHTIADEREAMFDLREKQGETPETSAKLYSLQDEEDAIIDRAAQAVSQDLHSKKLLPADMEQLVSALPRGFYRTELRVLLIQEQQG